MATACVGYVFPFGQMGFWGATAITYLSSPFPSLVELACGGHYVTNPTLKRLILFHLQFQILLCAFRIPHLVYLHVHSSHNALRVNTTNRIQDFFHLTSRFLWFQSNLKDAQEPINKDKSQVLFTSTIWIKDC